MKIFIAALTLICFSVNGLQAQEQFTSLFNGSDFTHWSGAGKTEIAGYQVKDGVITSTPQCRNLISEKEFENYVLEFEFRLSSGANNGLGIHYPGEGDAAYTGVEIQILDNTHAKYKDLKDYQFHGSLYTLAAAKRGHLMPVGQWNRQRVTVRGPKVSVQLNDVVITEADLDKLNKSHPEHEGAKRRKGKICFCGHGDIVSFRNIRIHEKSEKEAEQVKPTRSEVIQPIHNSSFNKNGACPEKKQGGNPRVVSGYQVFDGADDGGRQVDPQVAVGENHVLTATNTGLIIYNKQGTYVSGVSQNCFNGGIDPKLFYDLNNRAFLFDLWNPWDKEKKKPVNISVSESGDPTGAWNTYPVPAPAGVDGGGLGFSRKWIGYNFPGGDDRTFVLDAEQARAGKPATAYHFAGDLGHPVASQDPVDDLYFVKLTRRIEITRVSEGDDGTPVAQLIASTPHKSKWKSFQWPPQSPQKGTEQLTSSGDRNPKNLVLQGNHIWFSQNIKLDGRAGIRWNQIDLKGNIVQSGTVGDSKNSLIQTSISVNKQLDVMIGFQETGPDMFISPRISFRKASDPPGQMRKRISLGEGKGPSDGVSWGDYSGSAVDGANQTDLWSIQSIAGTDGQGDTVIVRVPIDGEPDLDASSQSEISEAGQDKTDGKPKLLQPTDWSSFKAKDFSSRVDEAAKRIKQETATGPFKPTWESLNTYEVPQWYQDAKFGIFIHWGVYCVPEFSSEWYPRNMYAVDGAVYKHHRENYGDQSEFGYKDFIKEFKAEKFDSDAWAKLFKESGAKYVVPVAEHHDGFPMYDCSFTQWSAAKMGPKRDIVGELAKSVRKEGLYLGVSSHRAFNWLYYLRNEAFDTVDPRFAGLYGKPLPKLFDPESIDYRKALTPHDEQFKDEWLARSCELIDKYQPDVFWFDFGIGFDNVKKAEENPWAPHLQQFAAYYYNHASNAQRRTPVMNYKWNAMPEQSAVLDLERSKLDKIRHLFWQTDTAVAKNSWCYTANQQYKTSGLLLNDLIDIVSKNGCMLLNVGPRKDGSIPEPEQKLLREMGAWLKVNGESIYGSRPFAVYGEGPTETVTGHVSENKNKPFGPMDFRYTTKGEFVYAFVLEQSESGIAQFKSLGKSSAHLPQSISKVTLLGSEDQIKWEQGDEFLEVKLPAKTSELPLVLKIECR